MSDSEISMDHQAISDSDVENLKIVVISKSEILMSLHKVGTFITYRLTQQKLDVSRYMMKLSKNRIAWESLNFLRSRVEVYPLNEVKLSKEVLT